MVLIAQEIQAYDYLMKKNGNIEKILLRKQQYCIYQEIINYLCTILKFLEYFFLIVFFDCYFLTFKPIFLQRSGLQISFNALASPNTLVN